MSNSAFDLPLASAQMLNVFSDNAVAQAMFRFEGALAQAQADCGLIPREAAQAIAGVCKAELYDVATIFGRAARAGSLAIPLVQELTHTVGLFNADAARYVHWGSTSQDVIDSAMVLLTRDALQCLDISLDSLIRHLLNLARAHLSTPVLARTLMQPAQVISFGLKVCNGLWPLHRAQVRLREQAAKALLLQCGGAVGTLSAMGERGPAVAARLGEILQLAVPALPWHTQRDEWVRLGLDVAILVGSLGKLATDLALMGQAEVGELSEPAAKGRGGSSAMPHKRNPVGAMIALAAAHRVPQRAATLLACMGQEHERGLGNWQAELAEWPALWIAAHAAVLAMDEVMSGLGVHAERMLANIDATHGLVYAEALSMTLAPVIGRDQAHHLVESWCHRVHAERRTLGELAQDALTQEAGLQALAPSRILALFDPHQAVQPAARLASQQVVALALAREHLPALPWPAAPDMAQP